MMGDGLWTMLTEGEPIMFLLVALSVGSLALIVVKVIALWPVTSGAAGRTAALALWANNDRHGAPGIFGWHVYNAQCIFNLCRSRNSRQFLAALVSLRFVGLRFGSSCLSGGLFGF